MQQFCGELKEGTGRSKASVNKKNIIYVYCVIPNISLDQA